jgi:hypothetical protein
MPPAKANTVATTGLAPATIREAVIAAPNVKDPSAVISGKSKIRKLIKLPKARRARISPMVIDPINSVIDLGF